MTPNGQTFRQGDMLWRCYLRDTGTYTWRADGADYAAQREGRVYKASAGAELLGDRYSTLAAAMGACLAHSIAARRQRRAAATRRWPQPWARASRIRSRHAGSGAPPETQ